MFGVVKIALAAMAAVNVSATKNWSLYDWRIESFLETSARIIATPVSDPSNGHLSLLAAFCCAFSGLTVMKCFSRFQALPCPVLSCIVPALCPQSRKLGTPHRYISTHPQ